MKQKTALQQRFLNFFKHYKWPYRLTILLLQCYIHLVSYYCIECIAGLEEKLIKIEHYDTTHYDFLFSVTAWPNVVLCLIGGILIDKIVGVRLGYILVVSIALFGQVMWILGIFFDYFWLMILGRCFLGIGNELIVVVSNAMKFIWFRNHMSFAISIDMASCRLGGLLALVVPGLLFKWFATFTTTSRHCLVYTFLVGAGGLLIALLATFIIAIMDFKGEKLFKQDRKFKRTINCRDIKSFPLVFWLIVVVLTLNLATLFSFTSIGQGFYIQKYKLGLIPASIANALVFSSVVLVSPIVGILVDRLGFNSVWAIVGLLIALCTHLMLMVSYGQKMFPFIAGIMYSISYTLIGPSLIPLPALLVRDNQVATAYGILKSTYNFIFSVLTITTGVLVDNVGYMILELFFTFLLYLAIMILVILSLIDWISPNKKINMSGSGRRRQKKEGIVDVKQALPKTFVNKICHNENKII